NAAVMVARANRPEIGVGGHIATYASAASLYEVGYNHFFRGRSNSHPGDQVFFQGHASPGIYARAYLEGRLSEQQMDGFRQEISHPSGGLPSYPHPRLMPDFWEFPGVVMGLSPLTAIYQARFNRYLRDRDITDTDGSHVWAFLGDGEMSAPESTGRSRSPPARGWTISPSSSIATCNSSTGRCTATERSCRISRRSSAGPAGTSSRSCGVATGIHCLPKTTTACLSMR